MDKIKLNYIVDVVMGISFLAAFITGAIKFPGLLRSMGIDVRTLPISKISRLHDWSGLVMGILVFVHLALHWNWIACMTKKYFARKAKTCKI